MPKIHEQITEETWIKHKLHKVEDHRILGSCMEGWIDLVYSNPGYNSIRMDLEDTVKLLFPERECFTIAVFNDHPDTTFDDVLRVFKVADA